MKLTAILLLAGTITGQAEATDLSQRIAKHNPSLAKSTVATVARELSKYPPIMTYIAQRESTFNPKAHSKGCIGLTGVNAHIWSQHLIEKGVIRKPHDLWLVKYNLRASWYIYKHYNKSYRKYRGLK